MEIVVPDPQALTPEQVQQLRDLKASYGIAEPVRVSADTAPTSWCTVGAFGGDGAWETSGLGRALRTEGRHLSVLSRLREALSCRRVLWVDTETYSPVNLGRATVYRYVDDPGFRLLLTAVAVGDGPVEHFEGMSLPEWLVDDLLDPEVLKIAWNAGFDRVALSPVATGFRDDVLSPESWVDAAVLCSLYGYPRSLKDAAVALGAEPKDEAGARLINLFSRPSSKGRVLPEDRPAEWAEFVRYCVQDVDTLRDTVHRLGCWFPTDTEERVHAVDQAVNDDGVRVDLDLARGAVSAAERYKTGVLEEIREVTGVANPNSRNQVLAWVNSRGVSAEDLTKGTVSALLDGYLPDDVRQVLTARQETALTAAAKFDAMLRISSGDSRARGVLVHAGAHTGRWASKGVQIHNLPRDSFTKEDLVTGKTVWDEAAENAAIDTVISGGVLPPSDLKKLIRASLVGPFLVMDYNAIEARVLAWLAGEEWVIDTFRADEIDFYVETARMLDPSGEVMSRMHGKVATLACGYGGSGHAMLKMGGRSLIEGQENMDDDTVARLLVPVVSRWRETHPRTVRFWAALERAFGRGGDAGRVDVEVVGDDRWLWLPSGRPLVYHNVRREWVRPPDGRPPKHTWHFDNPGPDRKRAPRVETYGGKLSENVTQAVARDLLADALVRLTDAGHRVVMHVHDEVLVETDGYDPLEEDSIISIMSTPPAWAAGLPLKVAGGPMNRYRKD